MNKYKVCVYAICKDEEKFVERWVNSMKEADEIYVLDTGSTDNTVKELRKRNVNVEVKKIEPWRFDVARNKSLELVPLDTDICVCTDLDEVFEKGWRNKLENAWNIKTTRARYNYNWSFDENGKPAVNFYIEKIHDRNNYKWTHPVHEVLTYIGNENESFTGCNQCKIHTFQSCHLQSQSLCGKRTECSCRTGRIYHQSAAAGDSGGCRPGRDGRNRGDV